ncbi:MAG: carotenoid oxygenase family protein [Myxococcota bacterium]
MQTSAPSPLPALPDWRPMLEDPRPQPSFVPLRVEGRLPPELRGTFVRNGPALSHAMGTDYEHWFDGDGGLVAVQLGDGRARGALRLIETAGLAKERKRGRRLFPGFGTHAPAWWHPWSVKNVANTNVIPWQGRLLALWEGGRPHEVSLETLQTRGLTSLGGVVPGAFSAHPHRVQARAAVYNFGVRPRLRGALLDLFELPDQGPARRLASLPLPSMPFIHDFIATERHLVFFISPVFVDIPRFLLGPRTYAECMQWKPEVGTEVLVVPIDDPARPVRFRSEASWQWHFGNAFERGDEIVVDLVRFDSFSLIGVSSELHDDDRGVVDHGWPARAVIDRRARSLRWETWAERSMEFPRVAPSVEGGEHRHVYMAAHGSQAQREGTLFDRIVKLDTSVGTFEEYEFDCGVFASEPIFTPSPHSKCDDDGWVMSLVYDAPNHRSHVAVFDAQDLSGGPVARVHFDRHVHYTFHGSFVPEAV